MNRNIPNYVIESNSNEFRNGSIKKKERNQPETMIHSKCVVIDFDAPLLLSLWMFTVQLTHTKENSLLCLTIQQTGTSRLIVAYKRGLIISFHSHGAIDTVTPKSWKTSFKRTKKMTISTNFIEIMRSFWFIWIDSE